MSKSKKYNDAELITTNQISSHCSFKKLLESGPCRKIWYCVETPFHNTVNMQILQVDVSNGKGIRTVHIEATIHIYIIYVNSNSKYIYK